MQRPNVQSVELNHTSAATIGWLGRALLLFLSIILLSLALSPVKQFYLAWVGLVPWLLVLRATRTKKAVFLWSWLAGTAFFLANMWWLWRVTPPGMFALTGYLGLFWGFAALIFVSCGLVPPREPSKPAWFSVSAIAVVWCALEWVRGNWSMFGNHGLPWLYLGHTQSPLLVMCQVADFGSAYAVSFWIVMVNALVFWLIVERGRIVRLVPAAAVVVSVILGTGIYGAWRLTQTKEILKPGPVVLVIQPNYPQSNTGEKGAPRDEIVRFHVETTRAALGRLRQERVKVDLIAWSETMMPALNDGARQYLANTQEGMFLRDTSQAIANVASESGAAMVVGGIYADSWRERGDFVMPTDRRNSAYFFEAVGTLSDRRYDKIHLVPFGEFIPFGSIPPLYSLLVKLGPKYYEDYILTPGLESAMTVFEAGGFRFVVPICFEDIVSPLVARMVRADEGSVKRADFLVNLTNDGWFLANEMPQHLQAAVFRSIENRVPTARAVNTGVSGFITSVGQTHDLVKAGTEGWEWARLSIDSRVTFYTRYGDVFAAACAIATFLLIVWSFARMRVTNTRSLQ